MDNESPQEQKAEVDEAEEKMAEDAEEMEEKSEKLDKKIKETKQDWEQNRRDGSVPGAPPPDADDE